MADDKIRWAAKQVAHDVHQDPTRARRTSNRDWALGRCIKGHPNSELRISGGKFECGPCATERARRHAKRRRATTEGTTA